MVRLRANLIAAAILSLSVLALTGCAKRPGAGSSTSQHSGAAVSPRQTASPGAAAGSVTLKPVGGAGSSSSSQPPGSTSPGGAATPEGTNRLLALRGGSPVYPSDYQIGALQPLTPAGTERGAIVRVIQKFFEGLAAGEVDTKLVSPQWKDEIVRQLSGPKRRGDLPDSVRIGIVSVEQDKAHAAIRMEKGSGSANGQIYLDRIGQGWYVSDLQVDFADLSKPAAKGPPFDPAEWKSMVKE